LGIPAALAARGGSWPKFAARDLVMPIGCLLIVMGCAALLAGMGGRTLARDGVIALQGSIARKVPAAKHVAFMADAAAHLAAYGVGFFGGLLVCGWMLTKRVSLSIKQRREAVLLGQGNE
jgi:hypothetical protein